MPDTPEALPHPDFLTESQIHAHLQLLFRKNKDTFATIAKAIHGDCVYAGWWSDLDTGQRKKRNFGELMALIMSEIAEAVSADGPDDKLPQHRGFTCEIADTMIRLFDLIGSGDFADATEVGAHFQRYLNQEEDPEYSWDCLLNEFILESVIEAWAEVFEAGRKSRPLERLLAKLFLSLYIWEATHLFTADDANLATVIAAKQAFNRHRPDHKISARLADDGKKI